MADTQQTNSNSSDISIEKSNDSSEKVNNNETTNDIKIESTITNDTNEDITTTSDTKGNDNSIEKVNDTNSATETNETSSDDNEDLIELPNTKEDDSESDDEQSLMEAIKLMNIKFNADFSLSEDIEVDKQYKLSKEQLNLKGIAEGIINGNFKNIIIMAGAGISVAAGIPDFRTPGTGLYSQLEKYNLDEPSDIFTLENNPKPFNILAKEMFPGNYKPTLAHYFGLLLHNKGLLLRDYTQNIDTLERVAGVPSDKLVEAHGAFNNAHCIDCEKKYSTEYVKKSIMNDEIPTCETCKGYVKPDIVFFGESLPERFFKCRREDFKNCDLLIVMGTSLTVHPFAGLVNDVDKYCVRLLINREEVGVAHPSSSFLSLIQPGGFEFNNPGNKRDVKWLGDIETGIKEFVKELGWEKELEELVSKEISL